MCEKQPAVDRAAMAFKEVYLSRVLTTDFPQESSW